MPRLALVSLFFAASLLCCAETNFAGVQQPKIDHKPTAIQLSENIKAFFKKWTELDFLQKMQSFDVANGDEFLFEESSTRTEMKGAACGLFQTNVTRHQSAPNVCEVDPDFWTTGGRFLDRSPQAS